MIIVEITGGLGNQMFQYAFGKAMAIANNCQLKLDVSLYKDYEFHDYSLTPFCIEADIASEKEIKSLRYLNGGIWDKIKRRVFKIKPKVLLERNLLFHPEYMDVKPPVYLIGYWQSEKYFQCIESIVRNHFRIKIPASAKNQSLLNNIIQQESVSLHIRRGNFVTIDAISKRHGTCSMEYYKSAIQMISSFCKKPVFYIFSNDISWAKENLVVDHPHVFVDINSEKTDYEDLRLMFSCKYHIIANSTFSWWGAWLCSWQEKKIIAPKQWFFDTKLNEESLNIVPDNWIRI